jgi:hypothetical protein
VYLAIRMGDCNKSPYNNIQRNMDSRIDEWIV